MQKGSSFLVAAETSSGYLYGGRRSGRKHVRCCYLAANMLYHGDDAETARLDGFAHAAGLPMVATNDVHYHVPERRPLQDILTCIREKPG